MSVVLKGDRDVGGRVYKRSSKGGTEISAEGAGRGVSGEPKCRRKGVEEEFEGSRKRVQSGMSARVSRKGV